MIIKTTNNKIETIEIGAMETHNDEMKINSEMTLNELTDILANTFFTPEKKKQIEKRNEEYKIQLLRAHALKIKEIQETLLEALDTHSKALQSNTGTKVSKHKIIVSERGYKNKQDAVDQLKFYTHKMCENKITGSIEDIVAEVVKGKTIRMGDFNSIEKTITFASSSLVVLDVDNADMKNYVSIEKFISLVGGMIVKPSAIAHTFSSKEDHNKYRVFFQLNDVVTDEEKFKSIYASIVKEVNTYFNHELCDKHVSTSHVLFGSNKPVCYINNEAIVNINSLSIEAVKANKKPKKVSVAKLSKSNTVVDIVATNDDMVSYIKSRNFRRRFVPMNELYEFINSNFKFTEVLGVDVNQMFKCIAHNDSNPSANVVFNGEVELYNCFSCDAKSLNMVAYLSKYVFKASQRKTLFIVARLAGISVTTEYKSNCKEMVEYMIKDYDNKNVIPAGSLLDARFKRWNLDGVYYALLNIAHVNIPYVSYLKDEDPERIIFYTTALKIQEYMQKVSMTGCDVKNIRKKLDTLADLGLITKIKDEDLKRDTVATAYQSSKNKKRASFIEIVDVTDEVLAKAEEVIINMENMGVKRSSLNSTRRSLAMSIEKVQNVNVQANVSETVANSLVLKHATKLLELSGNMLKKNRYITEDKLVSSFARSVRNDYKKEGILCDDHNTYIVAEENKMITYRSVVQDFIPLMVQTFGLKKIRVNKEVKSSLTLKNSIKSNSFIFVQSL